MRDGSYSWPLRLEVVQFWKKNKRNAANNCMLLLNTEYEVPNFLIKEHAS